MGIEFITYVCATFLIALFISAKADRRLLSFILVFWIFAQPVINSKFKITLGFMGFDLQPNRVLFIISLFYLFLTSKPKKDITPGYSTYSKPRYEIYFLIYLLLIIFSYTINISDINIKTASAKLTDIIIFLTVYYTAKYHITDPVLDSVFKAIVLMSILSAFIAIAQYAYNPLFLRTGEAKEAFGSVLRAYGVFQFDGDLSLFQTLASIIILVRYRNKIQVKLFLPLIVLSVLVGFQRLGYLNLFLSLMGYLAFFGQKKRIGPAILLTIFIPLMAIMSISYYKSTVGSSQAIEQRLEQDTVSGRLEQYLIVSKEMFKYPVGIGGYENPIYFKTMSKNPAMMKRIKVEGGSGWGRRFEPFVVHDGYLAIGMLHGVPSMLVFISILISMLWHFKNRINTIYAYSITPFYCVWIWIVGNTTQSLMDFNAYFVVLTGILTGAFAGKQGSDSKPQLIELKIAGR